MSAATTTTTRPRRLGKYEVFGAFASGGMASIHVGRLLGPAGFSKLVAVKQVSPLLARSDRHAKMLLEEARLTARIRSGNVVPILDVVHESGQLCIVMELVRGVSLGTLLRAVVARGERVPPPIASAIVSDALRGLHAAHEATDAHGKPLNIIHRDVSPHNLIVGADGTTRVLDFGIAKGLGSEELTHTGEVKGKPAYMPHEQLAGLVTRQSDIYAAGIVLWEAIVGARLRRDDMPAVLAEALRGDVPAPSAKVPSLPPALDEIVATAVAREPARRYATAEAMAVALEEACPRASRDAIARFVEDFGYEALESLDEVTRTCETSEAAPESLTRVAEPAPADAPLAAGGTPTEQASRPGPARAPSHLPIVLGAALVGIVFSFGLWSVGASRERARRIPEAYAEEALAPAPIASAPPPAVEPAAPAVAVDPTAAPASPAPAASSATTASTSARAPSIAPPPPKPRVQAPVKASCTPPFEYDENGRKRYKRECLP